MGTAKTRRGRICIRLSRVSLTQTFAAIFQEITIGTDFSSVSSTRFRVHGNVFIDIGDVDIPRNIVAKPSQQGVVFAAEQGTVVLCIPRR